VVRGRVSGQGESARSLDLELRLERLGLVVDLAQLRLVCRRRTRAARRATTRSHLEQQQLAPLLGAVAQRRQLGALAHRPLELARGGALLEAYRELVLEQLVRRRVGQPPAADGEHAWSGLGLG